MHKTITQTANDLHTLALDLESVIEALPKTQRTASLTGRCEGALRRAEQLKRHLNIDATPHPETRFFRMINGPEQRTRLTLEGGDGSERLCVISTAQLDGLTLETYLYAHAYQYPKALELVGHFNMEAAKTMMRHLLEQLGKSDLTGQIKEKSA